MRVGREFGLGMLLASGAALLIAVAETAVSDPGNPASLSDFVYGINLHLLLALIITALTGGRSAFLALAGLLAAEGSLVGGYWLSTVSFMPAFYTLPGKLVTALVLGLGGALGIAVAVAIRRCLGHERIARWQRSRARAGGFALALLLVVVNGGLLWSLRPSTSDRPTEPLPAGKDVVVILIDTLRRDHLSAFGYERPTSPHIDRLLQESWVFTSAYAPSTWTIPSVASLFTGLYPSSHQVASSAHRIPDAVPTLAEELKRRGYRTGAFIGNACLTLGSGYSRGFDRFFPPEPPAWCKGQRTAFERIAMRLARPGTEGQGGTLNQEALAWLEADPDRPAFLYMHYMEPHSSYVPPPEHREAVAAGVPAGPIDPPRFHHHLDDAARRDMQDWECLEQAPRLEEPALSGMIGNYDGEIHCVDAHIGRLLDGIAPDAHVLICTDHGEEFGDHGGWFHKHSIYEEMSGSPTAYRPPGGLPSPIHVDRPVAQLDVIRTLYRILNLEAPATHQGREIPELLGEAPPTSAPAVLCERPPFLFSLRHRRWKAIRRGPLNDPQWKLYDLIDDPDERRDLAAAFPDTLTQLREHLEALVADYQHRAVASEVSEMDAEMRERLRTLGYIN